MDNMPRSLNIDGEQEVNEMEDEQKEEEPKKKKVVCYDKYNLEIKALKQQGIFPPKIDLPRWMTHTEENETN